MIQTVSNLIEKLIIPEYNKDGVDPLEYQVVQSLMKHENGISYLIRYRLPNYISISELRNKLIDDTKTILTMTGFKNVNSYRIKIYDREQYIDVFGTYNNKS